jgi:NitT/TauT family transport system substrate-binding protein
MKRGKITVAYHPHIVGVGGILNAIDNGHFDKELLDVELVQFTNGAMELAVMASGQIDIGYIGVGAHVFAPQGQCKILALDSTDVSGEILVHADSDIKMMRDLKGRNVAITAGTTSDLILTKALQLAGMLPGDVVRINMEASGKVTAFMTDQIDAISLEAPYTDQIRRDMGADKVFTVCGSADFLPAAVFTNSWVTTGSFLESRPDLVHRFLKAWVRGTQERFDNMDATVEKVGKYINMDPAIVRLVAEKTNFLDIRQMRAIFSDGTVLKWYNTGKEMFLDAGLLDKRFDVPADDFVKTEYLLKAIEESGL